MRSPAATAMALRDVTRLCARCRIQASQALPLSRTSSRPAHSIASSTVRSFNKTLPQSYRSAAFFSSSSTASASAPESESNTSASDSNNSNTSPPTHYEIFPETLPLGPPPSGHFPINTRALRREFLALQARHHPDRHPHNKLRAEATSALINEAYKTLANPLLRAQYLLSLRGVDVATDETMQVDDPSLLMVVLEAHEEISDATAAEDLEELTAVNDKRIRESEEVLERAFREDDVMAAKKEAVRLRYWVNIKQSLDDWEEGKPVVLQH
ncbi:Fe-S protein assembly co-chaperone HscB [Trichoderma gamsii]|uniref:Fe-S protein assembly co-chaperone HscB n=1 Tax=Trichoderma gamsii TaxID=398673 RepID=A0A2P4ZI19_9HYPO|nr:Fe-S protein assembly co-chaperone HscB [Trichoderma gamsii]PON23936.1 Fe-S protein assembly co-chaperone HscB [Trichoderma gamsii]